MKKYEKSEALIFAKFLMQSVKFSEQQKRTILGLDFSYYLAALLHKKNSMPNSISEGRQARHL